MHSWQPFAGPASQYQYYALIQAVHQADAKRCRFMIFEDTIYCVSGLHAFSMRVFNSQVQDPVVFGLFGGSSY